MIDLKVVKQWTKALERRSPKKAFVETKDGRLYCLVGHYEYSPMLTDLDADKQIVAFHPTIFDCIKKGDSVDFTKPNSFGWDYGIVTAINKRTKTITYEVVISKYGEPDKRETRVKKFSQLWRISRFFNPGENEPEWMGWLIIGKRTRYGWKTHY